MKNFQKQHESFVGSEKFTAICDSIVIDYRENRPVIFTDYDNGMTYKNLEQRFFNEIVLILTPEYTLLEARDIAGEFSSFLLDQIIWIDDSALEFMEEEEIDISEYVKNHAQPVFADSWWTSQEMEKEYKKLDRVAQVAN